MRKKIIIFLGATLATAQVFAGNPQRVGSAGASELLINPWARSTGWSSVNVAGVKGVESSFLNIAGSAQTERTDVGFANTQWLVGSQTSFNSFGFLQKVGSNGVMGASVIALDYGDWEITNEDNPDGGIGSISPSQVTIGISYAQKFTQSILGGVNIKMYSLSSQNLSVGALCFDAGVQYITGKEDQVKFGITLKNVGPSASFKGDGKSIVLPVPSGGYSQAYNERSASFEFPATLMIGGSYDFKFSSFRFTPAVAFQSNSFEQDHYTLGGEIAFKEIFMLRTGYTFIGGNDQTQRAPTGLGAGASVNVPMGDSHFTLDYSYRATRFFSGIHSIGISFSL